MRYPYLPPPQRSLLVVVEVEREARQLLRDLAGLGLPLPPSPALYGRPLLHALPDPPEPEAG
jgi:hypothetical protein